MGLEQWAQAIKLDPNWNGGNYYDGDAPLEGVTLAQAMITQGAMHPEYITQAVPKAGDATSQRSGIGHH